IIWLQIFHFCIFMLYEGEFSPQFNLVHFNVLELENLPSVNYVTTIFSMIQGVYYANLYYLQNNGLSTRILKQILFRQPCTFLMDPNFSGSGARYGKQQSPIKRCFVSKSKDGASKVQRLALPLQN